MNKKYDVSIIGLGYIGIPLLAAVSASAYKHVLGVDTDINKLSALKNGELPINEPGIKEILFGNANASKITYSDHYVTSNVIIITVPTPFDHERGHADLTHINEVILSVFAVLEGGELIIIESTCPVGTTEKIYENILTHRPDLLDCRLPDCDSTKTIYMSYCPERIIPGSSMYELYHNDRVVGGVSRKSAQLAKAFYESFVIGDVIIAETSREAEMCKLVENASRDVSIALANEISNICDDLNVDTWNVIKLANRHPRVNLMRPGPGVGGHCIAIDPLFLISASPLESKLLRMARNVNNSRPEKYITELRNWLIDNTLKKLIIFGITYKPDVDDIRESPSLLIYEVLDKEFPGRVLYHDPFVPQLTNEKRSIDPNKIEGEFAGAFLVAHSNFADQFSEVNRISDPCGIWEN